MPTAEIREYTKNDIPEIIALCKREIPQLEHYKHWPVDEMRLRFLLVNNVNNKTFLCLVVCDSQTKKIVGGIAALTSQCFFNNYMIASDIFLFIEQEYRTSHTADKLIDAYVFWALARGARLVTASQTSGYRAELMERLLSRHKFKKVGNIYHYGD